MRKITAIILFASSLLFITNCRPKKITPLTEDEAINIIKRFDEGWEHKDLELVDSCLSPNYIYFTQSGGLFSRDSVVATAGSPSYSLTSVERSSFSVLLEDNVAIVSTRWKGVGEYRGRPFDEDQRCSITVVKRNGKIEILSEHCTPIKQMPIFH
ncbi:MAG: nuclear transport factor 2 family protein [Chitinophagaceae bacterium]|nr:nuclear transport factor 2 family protein [Chitinophagaceae bacterium]